jgi:hypothetical protein
MKRSWMDNIERDGSEHLGDAIVRLAYQAMCEHQRLIAQQSGPPRPVEPSMPEARR